MSILTYVSSLCNQIVAKWGQTQKLEITKNERNLTGFGDILHINSCSNHSSKLYKNCTEINKNLGNPCK